MLCCQQEPHRPWSPPVVPTGPGRGAAEVDQVSAKRPRDDSLMPLVIPVSVPVRQTDSSSPDHEQASLSASWPSRPHDMSCSNYQPSVIVTRRRSLRNSPSESTGQVSLLTDLTSKHLPFYSHDIFLFLPTYLLHPPPLSHGLKFPNNPQISTDTPPHPLFVLCTLILSSPKPFFRYYKTQQDHFYCMWSVTTEWFTQRCTIYCFPYYLYVIGNVKLMINVNDSCNG